MDGGLRKLKSEDGVVFEIEENCLFMSNFLILFTLAIAVIYNILLR